MARALTMCGSSELTLADCDDCSKLLSRLEQLENRLEQCCTEVKNTLSAHDTRITTNTNNIATNTGDIATNATNIQANTDALSKLRSDLANYYTKEQVNSMIDGIENVEIKVVDELPDEGETNIIYLVPKEDGETPNVYNEYVYVGSWEKIGDTDIDLSDYLTMERFDAFEENEFFPLKDDVSEINTRTYALEGCCEKVNSDFTDYRRYVNETYQPKLTAGDNITIENNVISATGGALTKDAILEALGYKETTISMTDTTGATVTRTILVKEDIEPEPEDEWVTIWSGEYIDDGGTYNFTTVYDTDEIKKIRLMVGGQTAGELNGNEIHDGAYLGLDGLTLVVDGGNLTAFVSHGTWDGVPITIDVVLR